MDLHHAVVVIETLRHGQVVKVTLMGPAKTLGRAIQSVRATVGLAAIAEVRGSVPARLHIDEKRVDDGLAWLFVWCDDYPLARQDAARCSAGLRIHDSAVRLPRSISNLEHILGDRF